MHSAAAKRDFTEDLMSVQRRREHDMRVMLELPDDLRATLERPLSRLWDLIAADEMPNATFVSFGRHL
jgi:hypothetical protein